MTSAARANGPARRGGRRAVSRGHPPLTSIVTGWSQMGGRFWLALRCTGLCRRSCGAVAASPDTDASNGCPVRQRHRASSGNRAGAGRAGDRSPSGPYGRVRDPAGFGRLGLGLSARQDGSRQGDQRRFGPVRARGSAPAERRGLCGLPGVSADGHCAALRFLSPLADPARLERETDEPCPRLNHRPAGEAAAVRRRGAAAARALWRSGIRRVGPPSSGRWPCSPDGAGAEGKEPPGRPGTFGQTQGRGCAPRPSRGLLRPERSREMAPPDWGPGLLVRPPALPLDLVGKARRFSPD